RHRRRALNALPREGSTVRPPSPRSQGLPTGPGRHHLGKKLSLTFQRLKLGKAPPSSGTQPAEAGAFPFDFNSLVIDLKEIDHDDSSPSRSVYRPAHRERTPDRFRHP